MSTGSLLTGRRSLRKKTSSNSNVTSQGPATSGAMLMRNVTKSMSAALPIMMFGGSPTSVATPPMFDSMASAIRNGAGFSWSRRVTSMVSGAKMITVVTLSRIMLSTLIATPR